jgi:oxalate---CoA ligase
LPKTFGCTLPLATLFQHQTIGQFATALDDVERDRSWESLVKIKTGNPSKPPIFFLHDVSGSVLFYQQLAEHLPSDQTCYIIQPQGLDGKSAPIDRIDRMAANYIAEILQVQPQGAYYLAGYSFGGVLAFEIARQLHDRGCQIGLLAILDTKAPVGDRVSKTLPLAPESKLSWYRQRASKFVGLNWQQRRDYLREGLRIHRTTGKLRPLYRFYLSYIKHSLAELGSIDVYWTNERIFHSYEVTSSYPIAVTLFCASDRLAALAANPYLNWDRIATGGIQVHIIPDTNHATIIKEPHVRLLAEKLTLAIDNCQNPNSADRELSSLCH